MIFLKQDFDQKFCFFSCRFASRQGDQFEKIAPAQVKNILNLAAHPLHLEV